MYVCPGGGVCGSKQAYLSNWERRCDVPVRDLVGVAKSSMVLICAGACYV